ncbi:MAG: hypothetical protein F9K13_09830 [Candidatus Methylomirabilis oxygeniifera]|uniref:FlgD/Vpr Ig-like domain-containing protein n=1 Tax=Methylomirabilis oxygeniifera TaxID=671143 RepID=D5MGC6_METO1|nr:MAG: hypothetical protein F9K13_09830 [Candidatus Methylomirabilis oxyfera]CBE68807.1 protein of unknown function [Candidatus Methylomirabilis oxyfera]
MIPVLAAVGIRLLGALAGKTVTALIERGLDSSTAADRTERSFDTILERSQSMRSTRSDVRRVGSPSSQGSAPTVISGSADDTSVGLLTAQLATGRTSAPATALPAVSRRPIAVEPSAFSLQPSAARSRAAQDLIGRKIAANGSAIELRGSVPPTLLYRLPTAAESVRIEVRDLQGTIVGTVQLGPQPGGFHQMMFDGRGLQSGLYTYRVIATDAAGQPMARVSTAFGRVMGVQFENGQPFLHVGSALVPLTGIFEVSSDQR